METVLFNLRHNTKANPAFMSLLKSDAHKGARKLMEGVYSRMTDPNGNKSINKAANATLASIMMNVRPGKLVSDRICNACGEITSCHLAHSGQAVRHLSLPLGSPLLCLHPLALLLLFNVVESHSHSKSYCFLFEWFDNIAE